MFLLFYARRFSGNASSNLKGSDRMRRFTAFLAALLLLFGAARAETVSFGSVSFDRNAETIDLGDQVVGNWADFSAFLKKFPNLKKVDMYAFTYHTGAPPLGLPASTPSPLTPIHPHPPHPLWPQGPGHTPLSNA